MGQWFLVVLIPLIFISVGAILPFINSEFGVGVSTSSPDVSNLEKNITSTVSSVDNPVTITLGFWDILLSIAKMFFWTFGDLPLVIDLFFLLLRITWLILLAEVILP